MDISFPAMRGRMGNREYYVAMVKLNLVPRLFKFQDWAELPPEQRAQRVIQKNRIPEITQYILDNEDGYLFSSLTTSFDREPSFKPINGHEDIGTLELPFESEIVINDGQHRRAAIEEALKENPMIGNETISVVLFPMEDLDRMQQMFSDLNRTVRKTSKSLDILYNHRDLMSQITLTAIEQITLLRDYVDKDRVSLPQRSPKMFTLSSLHQGTKELLGSVVELNFEEKLSLATEFWNAVSDNMLEWQSVQDRILKPMELRNEFVNSHSAVIIAVGIMGRTLVTVDPVGWKERLAKLRQVDWRRTNNEWQGILMSGSKMVNRHQTRKDTAAFLKGKFGLDLTESEQRSLRAVSPEHTVRNPHRTSGYTPPSGRAITDRHDPLGRPAASEEDWTNGKPKNIVILGQAFPVGTWADALVRVCEEMAERHPAEFEERITRIRGDRWKYFSRKPSEMMDGQCKLIGNTRIYAATKYNANEIAKRCGRILEEFGYSRMEVEFTCW